jgi:import inner membrane translocase subunit TIM16
MSLDEAHLILNSKKEDALEVIEKVSLVCLDGICLSWPYPLVGHSTDMQNFETLFKANSPPPEAAPSAKPSAPTSAATRQTPASRKSKQPQYSHYLQSKVYRALERIKAERDTGAPPPPTTPEAGAAGADGVASAAAPGMGSSTAPPGGTTL